MSRWDNYTYYPKSKPKKAKNGIKAHSKNGGFGKNWWAKRWIAVLEGFRIGARLSRGRSYARSGQVLSIEIKKGSVKAKVQGSRVRPYNVEINVKTLQDQEWEKISRALSERPVYAAAMLAGNMPPDIEEAFQASGLSLFPERYGDLTTKCSCPDSSNPCKHIAAVYYLLGEEFDRDPFLLFRLRGRDRAELLSNLSLERGSIDITPAGSHELDSVSAHIDQAESLAIDINRFWHGGQLPGNEWPEIRLPAQPATLIKQLGNFPFWRGNENLTGWMEKIYTDASQTGLDLTAKLASSIKSKPQHK